MEKDITEDVLRLWESPDTEASLAKGIPMGLFRFFAKRNVGKYRYRYRGPSKPGYDRPQSYITKDQAETFAVYRKYPVPVPF